MASDYKDTLLMPDTTFPMRGQLPKQEPQRLALWQENDLYAKVQELNRDGELFVLHDGPPYANGEIHIGHAFNKVLKDIVLKSKAQRGYKTPYVPGWDCHGQPIEHVIEKKLGPEKFRSLPTLIIRRLCREYAEKQIELQREGFKRLGVNADWEHPYLTYTPEYEAVNVEVFKDMFAAGMIYKGSKPVHWCPNCRTALAEAEIEYHEDEAYAIYVKFALTTLPEGLECESGRMFVVVWTTTPWTLPANQAVILNPQAEYVALKYEGDLFLCANELASSLASKFGWNDAETVGGWSATGLELAGTEYEHPIFEDVRCPVICADYVTLTDGTGAVHCAPGHGAEDFLAGREYGLDTVMPVDDDGRFYKGDGLGTGGPFSGMLTDEANPHVIEWLEEKRTLVLSEKLSHSYPHCWRCHKPVIFRATSQWFVSMDETGLREHALAAARRVSWHPAWSVNRFSAMVENRPDWCISRQRSWGVPVPVFTCSECGDTVAGEQVFDAVARLFREHGADAWYEMKPSEYLPHDTTCPSCGSGVEHLVAGRDILDVWWESGVSHAAVLEQRNELRSPADLYLEGSDQHRGWFQSSMLTSVGSRGRAPYESVMHCGFVVDGEGRKMSKSAGNGISPSEVVDKYGADVLRLWVCSCDAFLDVSISDEILKQVSETYRKLRNTLRFMLGNLFDFSVEDVVGDWNALELSDRYFMSRLAVLVRECEQAFDDYRFANVYRTCYDFVNAFSSQYMDAAKDRLYTERADSPRRRAAQTVLYNALEILVRVLCPVLSFTCDEVWGNYPESLKDANRPFSVQLSGWKNSDSLVPAVPDECSKDVHLFEEFLEVRDCVYAELERVREIGTISKSQEAAVELGVPETLHAELDAKMKTELLDLLVVSNLDVSIAEELKCRITKTELDKCPRCWNHRELVDHGNVGHVCRRCAEVLSD